MLSKTTARSSRVALLSAGFIFELALSAEPAPAHAQALKGKATEDVGEEPPTYPDPKPVPDPNPQLPGGVETGPKKQEPTKKTPSPRFAPPTQAKLYKELHPFVRFPCIRIPPCHIEGTQSHVSATSERFDFDLRQ